MPSHTFRHNRLPRGVSKKALPNISSSGPRKVRGTGSQLRLSRADVISQKWCIIENESRRSRRCRPAPRGGVSQIVVRLHALSPL